MSKESKQDTVKIKKRKLAVMNAPGSRKTVILYFCFLMIFWTGAIAISAQMELNRIESQSENFAINKTRSLLEKDITYYRWVGTQTDIYFVKTQQDGESPASNGSDAANQRIELMQFTADALLGLSQNLWAKRTGSIIAIYTDFNQAQEAEQSDALKLIFEGRAHSISGIRTNDKKEYMNVMLPLEYDSNPEENPNAKVTKVISLQYPMQDFYDIASKDRTVALGIYTIVWLLGIALLFAILMRLFMNLRTWDRQATEQTKLTDDLQSKVNLRTQDVIQLQRNLQDFMDHLPLPAYIKNKDSAFIAVNQQFADSLGCSKEKLLGSTGAEYLPPELADYFYQFERIVFNTGDNVTVGNFEFAHHGLYSGVMFPNLASYGQVEGVSAIFTSLSQLPEIQGQHLPPSSAAAMSSINEGSGAYSSVNTYAAGDDDESEYPSNSNVYRSEVAAPNPYLHDADPLMEPSKPRVEESSAGWQEEDHQSQVSHSYYGGQAASHGESSSAEFVSFDSGAKAASVDAGDELHVSADDNGYESQTYGQQGSHTNAKSEDMWATTSVDNHPKQSTDLFNSLSAYEESDAAVEQPVAHSNAGADWQQVGSKYSEPSSTYVEHQDAVVESGWVGSANKASGANLFDTLQVKEHSSSSSQAESSYDHSPAHVNAPSADAGFTENAHLGQSAPSVEHSSAYVGMPSSPVESTENSHFGQSEQSYDHAQSRISEASAGIGLPESANLGQSDSALEQTQFVESYHQPAFAATVEPQSPPVIEPVIVEEPVKPSSVPLRALLINDDANESQTLADSLTKLGHSVKIFDNATSGIENMMHNTYDVIFMDIQMPVMNGIQATAVIRKHERQARLERMPIIAMTTHSSPGDKDKYKVCGMDNFIIVTAPVNDVSALIEETISEFNLKG
jgi:CheY-like chemotaxis protein/PAS domain-containing protein